MKKLSILSLLVILTMLLAACGGGGAIDETPGVGTDVLGTDIGGEFDLTGTPVVGGGLDMTSTPAVGGDMTSTPEVGGVMTSTPDMGVATATTSGGTGVGETTPAVPVTGSVQAQDCVKASVLLGLDVNNTEGEDLGEVNDVIVDASTGQFEYLVLGAGGVLGIGEKNIAIPWDRVDTTDFECDTLSSDMGTDAGTGSGLDMTATPGVGAGVDMTATPGGVSGSDMSGDLNFVDHLVVDIPQDALESAPDIDLDTFDFSVSNWDDEFNSFWMNLDSSVSGSSSDTVATATPASGANNGSGGQSASGSQGVVNIVLLSKLMDAEVRSNAGVGSGNNSGGTGTSTDATATPGTGVGTGNNAGGSASDEGDVVGEVDEVIYDAQSGMVKYVVIDPEDSVVTDDVLVPVPLDALKFFRAGDSGNDLRIMVNQNQLSSAPNFPSADFPYGVQNWDSELSGFWNIDTVQ